MLHLAQEHVRFSTSGFDRFVATNRTAGGAEKQGLKNFAQWVGCRPQYTFSDSWICSYGDEEEYEIV